MADTVYNTTELIDCIKKIQPQYGSGYVSYGLVDVNKAVEIAEDAILYKYGYDEDECRPDPEMLSYQKLSNLPDPSPDVHDWDSYYQWVRQNGLHAVVFDGFGDAVPNFYVYNKDGQEV